jgi:glycosidase
VLEKLDHIAALGATCIWLSPVFPSPTTHGYDATDYLTVEPRLGGEPALRELVAAAHARGIRIVLDLVCNHLSNQHPFFLEAAHDPHSRYRDWFTFDDSPLGYRAFFGVRSMPQINLLHSAAREWMIGIARYWLEEFDVDGYRLDHANGPGPSFWSEFRMACKQARPDSFAFGEIVEPLDAVRRYKGRLDGHLDFILADYLRRAYGDHQLPLPALDQFLEQHATQLDPGYLSLSFLDNHDMDRFLFLAGGDKQALRNAAALQLRLPSPPVIYYGTEVGMSQTLGKAGRAGLEASRAAMLWEGQQDRELFAWYHERIAERRATRPWALRARSREHAAEPAVMASGLPEAEQDA